MNKPEIRVIPYRKGGQTYIVYFDDCAIYKCLDKEAAESVEDMINALCMVWEELESKEDWGEDLSPSQIKQIHESLLKAGVEI